MSTPLNPARPDPQGPDNRPRFGLADDGSRHGRAIGRLGALVAAIACLVLIGGLVLSATTGTAPASQHPHLFGGSLVLDDYRPLTVIDVATGAVTVQLEGVYAQVGADDYSGVQAVPTSQGTMLVNRATGAFNMLGEDNYILGPPAKGISLGALAGAKAAAGFASGADAYIVRYAPHSTVSLVGAKTVLAGAQALSRHSGRTVSPLGFSQLGGAALGQPGGAVVSGHNLWVLEAVAGHSGPKCQLVELSPSSRGAHGLVARRRSSTSGTCTGTVVESGRDLVGLASPGHVELFLARGRQRPVNVAASRGAAAMLPVVGAGKTLWFLYKGIEGWYVMGVKAGGEVVGPNGLANLGLGSLPVAPVYSAGKLYTLDQAQVGQPALATVNPLNGDMSTVPHVPAYPADDPSQPVTFMGAEVLVDGPRVIYNNPDSLLAVVVFTDGSHAPVIVDKSRAVTVSAVGPGDVNVKQQKVKQHHQASGNHTSTTQSTVAPPVLPPVTQPPVTQPSATVPLTVVPGHPASAKQGHQRTTTTQAAQPVSQQVNCAASNQPPYAPVIASVTPAAASAMVTWSYHVLDEQDCLPSTWSVTVTALDGGAQPTQATQVVNGQQQLLFTGLNPQTTYQVVVTAYINSSSAVSAPVVFSTSAAGPAAPANVTTTADGNGGWLVSWQPCSGTGCGPAPQSWSVIGSSCSTTFVGQPPEKTVPASTTSISVNAGNGLGLLGGSLSFSVEGVGSSGLVGKATSDGACTLGWRPPDKHDLRLLAAGHPAAGQTIAGQLQLQVAPSVTAVDALGGDAVTYDFYAGGHSSGPQSSAQATIPGLSPSNQYVPSVVVTPVGHPSAAVTITGASFSQALPWPADLAMQIEPSVGTDADNGTVAVKFPGLPAGSYQAAGTLTCGSESMAVNGSLASGQFDVEMDLDQLGGNCQLQLSLQSTATPNPYGVASPSMSGAFTIGAQAPYSFDATASEQCGHCADLDIYVSYGGTGQPAGTNWQVTGTSSAPGCNTSTPATATAGFPVELAWPIACPIPQLAVSWVYLGQPQVAKATLPSGSITPPGTTTTTTSPSGPSTPVTTAPCPAGMLACSVTTTAAPTSTTSSTPTSTSTSTSTSSTSSSTTTSTSVPASTTTTAPTSTTLPVTTTTTGPTTTVQQATSTTSGPTTTVAGGFGPVLAMAPGPPGPPPGGPGPA